MEAEIEEVKHHYEETIKQVTWTHKRTSLIKVRILERGVEKVKEAITGCKLDPWPERWRYNDITDILGTPEKMDRFIEFAQKERPRRVEIEGDVHGGFSRSEAEEFLKQLIEDDEIGFSYQIKQLQTFLGA